MKKKSLLLVLISLILGFSTQGQIVTKYQQGFETSGESYSYSVSQGTATPVTTVYSSGNRSLKLQHGSNEVIVVTDTIDMSDNSSFTSFYLEFMHICDVDPLSCNSASEVATVEGKFINESTWWVLDGVMYDVNWGGGSEDFASLGSFSERSYDIWRGTTPANTWWKRERFSLTNKCSSQSLSQRKLQIRFRLKARTASGATTEGWYLDNITFKCSPSSMVLPIAKMVAYPDLMDYPNSRGAHIMADITTTTVQGICADSVYIVYQLGSSAPIRRMTMNPVTGVANRYEAYIPFCGYDTIVNWRMVAKDATTNHNQTTFPMDETGWEQYRCIRGKDNNAMLGSGNAATNSFPFANLGRFKSQMVYDSTELAEMGYKAGAITRIQYNAASNVANSQHNHIIISMRNVPSDYVMNAENKFNTDFARVVYDSSLTITQNNNTTGTINLQDTFFYAGKGLMVNITYKNTSGDPGALSLKSFPSSSSAYGSLYTGFTYSSTPEEYFDPFTGGLFTSGTYSQQRPRFTFKANANQTLIYDCGVSAFITPNDTTTGNAVGNNDVIVTLKNYGASPINAVRIYYTVDGGAAQYYDWSGNLAGGATTNVTINTTQTYAVGYHEMLAWVDDSVTVNGQRYRDHEPYNDTLWTRFTACDGPMSGTRYVGGSTPDYATLEKFLYAVSLCGVNGPLTVKLAPGSYQPVVFPSIPGTSVTNYVKFEPSDASSNSVVFEKSASADATVAPYLMNLQAANHIWLNRIVFSSSVYVGSAANYQVRLGLNSTGCKFTECTFAEGSNPNQPSYMIAVALIYSGGCDSLTVDNCQFSRGTTAISLIGPAQDNMAHGSSILNSRFYNQGTTGVIVRNQVNPRVDSNYFNDVYANSSYVILIQDCYGTTRVTRNTVYVTSGASCIGATGLEGSLDGYAVIANNMLVSNDDGTSNMLTTPLNIITAKYAKVLFNSIKMTAPTRSGIAAATFGGGSLDSSMFYNNIVSCFDTVNFAFNFLPSEGSTNYVGYNIYYSKGPLLNKYSGINCMSLANWQGHCTMDGLSQEVNPAFLNVNATDLRSYSQNVKGHAIPFAEVDNDIFGTERDSVAPCIGAFEFAALPYDFEIEQFIEPYDEYCDAPTAAPLRVVIKNSGINAYTPNSTSPLYLTYSRANAPGVITPGYSGNILVNITVPASDTVTYNTGITLPFPPNGMQDTTYKLYVWLSSTIDVNPANDTNFTTVTSHYHAPAPDSITLSVNYGTAATITATGGLQTWYPNVYTQGNYHTSEVYWYTSPSSTEPIWRGKTYVTDPLYTDTTFYIRQKRDYPLVKITEVQLKNNMPGITYPMPLWMNSATTFAIEFTNVGDYPANMADDTVMIVSNTNTYNNKIYKFPNVTIEPGHSLVLQYRGGVNNVDSSLTIATATLNVANMSTNIGIIYKNDGVIEDAVALNDITSQTQWTNLNVPPSVWSGSGITLPDSTAGIYRLAWPTTPNNIVGSALLWQIADGDNLMTMGTTNENLMRFFDNGCEGDVAPVHISLINLPDVDMVVTMSNDDLEALLEPCGLGVDTLKVNIANMGSQSSGTIIAHYQVTSSSQHSGQCIHSQSCSDTLAALGFLQSTNHTFSIPVDFSVAWGSTDFSVLIWVEKISADNTNFNDTIKFTITSSFTPTIPNVSQYDTVNYGERLTMQALTGSDSLGWYDRNMNPLDTTAVFTTDYLYLNDTFYVSAFGTRDSLIHIGTLASTNSATGYPSPYNPNKKYVKEQYLFTADELIAAGHSAGAINSVSFYLDTILAAAGTMTFTNYSISVGTTNAALFTGNGAWCTVTEYSNIDSLTLTNSTKGWIRHDFDNPFIWDGSSNIVVQVMRAIDPNISQGAKTRYTGGATNKVLYKNNNNNDLSGNGTRSANRPDIKFGFLDYGCEGPRLPIYVNIIGTPDADAYLMWPDGSDTVNFASCDTSNFDVSILNMGMQPFGTYTVDYWIDTIHGVYNGTTILTPNQRQTFTIAQHHFTPGRHHLRAAVTLSNDTVHSNDTIERIINVRFCAGTYTIGATGDYVDFTTAIDTLNAAGIDGPVIFSVQSGNYNEQLNIGYVDGMSATNTLTFCGAGNAPEDVVLYYNPSNTDNYVVKLDGAEFLTLQNMKLYSTTIGNSNYANVLSIANSHNIHLSGNLIRVKGTVNNVNASCIVVGAGVSYLYLDSNVVDSGYYSVRSMVSVPGASEGLYFNKNTISNFLSQGINLRKVNDVYIADNSISTGVTANSRALTGIFVAEHNGPITIERNNIAIEDSRNGGKQGIHLVNVNGSNATRSHIFNNMTAMVGTGNAGQTTCGIFIDSSTWVNVYYNSSQVYLGNGSQGMTARAFSVENSSSIHVMNNIFSNISKGYAYYVKQAANVAASNYNNYWSNSEDRLAYWGAEAATMDDLRGLASTLNGAEVSSTNLQPYFISRTDLHLSIGTYCERAQYNTEVPLDIDGYIRPQIPNPCMGAHEFVRKSHNLAVMDILAPALGVTDNVESDTLIIIVKLTNDGTSTETGKIWWAEIDGTNPLLRSENKYIDELQPQDVIIDTTYIVMPVGIIDTQRVCIYFPLANDSVPENNVLCGDFFLDPAYNLQAISVTVSSGDGCRLQNTPIDITMRNVGRKAFPAGAPISIGCAGRLVTSNVTVTTLPFSWVENSTIAAGVDTNSDVTIHFSQTANLYPTGIAQDINVQVRTWVTHMYDQKPLNDTTLFTTVTSKYTPSSPVGVDLHIPYATWDTIFASQTDIPPSGAAIHRPIRWYRDSTEAPYHEPNSYAMSCWWETPQYFHDSTYFLNCVSTSGCTSYYSPVHVNLNPRVPVDMAVLQVVEPQAKEVYMIADSVKVELINYGNQPITNIPVVYQLYSPSGELLQYVTETCHHTIQPDSTYIFKFDSLIHIPEWSNTTPYKIRTWTNMSNENVRLNDTLRGDWEFFALQDNSYPQVELDSKTGLDITRVSFSSLDNDVSPVGHRYLNFTNATSNIGAVNSPSQIINGVQDFGGKTSMQNIGSLRALHLVKGTTDTMIVECANSDRNYDINTSGWVTVFIDQDRDGEFLYNPLHNADGTVSYEYPYSEVVFQDSIRSQGTVRLALTIPETMRTGYTRMRVVLVQGSRHATPADSNFQFGQVQDYLLYIEDEPVEIDLCASRIENPRDKFIGGHTGYTSEDSVTVSFVMSNKGANPITSAEITYAFLHKDDTSSVETLQWSGMLDRGGSTEVQLPEHQFLVGTTDLMIVVSTLGDTITYNDTLWYQYYRAPVLRLQPYVDYFEDDRMWFVPKGYTAYTQNLWQRGYPQKNNIMACMSDSNVWATNINGGVNAYNTGAYSVMYMPIFDISIVRPDTLSLWIASDMAEGHLLSVEFYDYLERWTTLGSGSDTMLWFTAADGWSGSTSGYGYVNYKFKTSSLEGDMLQRLQLRFIYKASTETDPCDGAAIDDLVFGRAKRPIDVGVVDIVHPTEPKFGQVINPIVVIKNFGLDTIYSASVGYFHYGANLPKISTYTNAGGLKPGETDTYTFPASFVVKNDFPDTFTICAFTRENVDLYYENDSTCGDFYLSPLDNDIAMVSFLSPLDHIVAGDSVTVTTRIRNYGQIPFETARLTYIYNHQFVVTEEIDFVQTLGHALQSFEYFNYTFKQKFRASMGMMDVEAFIDMDEDDYIYNDTINKRVNGLSAIVDLKAREVLVDVGGHNVTKIHLVIDNVGARSANDFEVGFWYYNDTTTLRKYTYHGTRPVAALTTLVYTFPDDLVSHAEYYNYVTGYVSAVDDNDRSNDTTDVIGTSYLDLRAVRVIVEENREDSCRVRMEIDNVGTVASIRDHYIDVTVNGVHQYLEIESGNRSFAPGDTVYTIEMKKKIPKSPTRTYVGTGKIETSGNDPNPDNNQTNIVEVLNYFEGVPVVPASNGMILEQNYPNPFENSTRIDFYLPESGKVRFFVIDELGRMVYQDTRMYGAGDHSVDFSDSSLSAGVYFYGIEMNGQRLMRKMVLKR
mgnify:CR=1 FL=1